MTNRSSDGSQCVAHVCANVNDVGDLARVQIKA
jgi:hypothetical protein